MSNLEIRVRHSSMTPAEALPLAEIPYRHDVIRAAQDILADVGGVLFGLDLTDDNTILTYQFAEDGVRAFLDIVIDGPGE